MACNSCSSPENLDAIFKNPSMLTPTFEFRLRTINLPLDQQDLQYLGTEIKVFAEEESIATAGSNVNRSTTSRNFEQPEFQLPTDFIAMGICALAYVEPYGMGVDGNFFSTPAQVCAFPLDLLSPDVMFDEIGAFPGAAGAQFSGLTNMCPAQLDWGHATWKFADWFMKTYRMSVGCQISNNVHEILNERLIDMGNCCADSNKEGFGAALGSYIEAARSVNERLNEIAATPALLPDAQAYGVPQVTATNIGNFAPLNATATLAQNATGGASLPNRRIITQAARLNVQPQAFGGLQAEGAGMRWYKFDQPRVIRAHRNIKISLNRYDEDMPNFARMIREGSLRVCEQRITGNCATPPAGNQRRICVGDASSYTAYARSSMARIPGGRIQIGIGLKGLILDNNLCNDVENIVNNLSVAQCQALGWTGGPCRDQTSMAMSLSKLIPAGGSCGA